jgi:hypothetical protein
MLYKVQNLTGARQSLKYHGEATFIETDSYIVCEEDKARVLSEQLAQIILGNLYHKENKLYTDEMLAEEVAKVKVPFENTTPVVEEEVIVTTTAKETEEFAGL